MGRIRILTAEYTIPSVATNKIGDICKMPEFQTWRRILEFEGIAQVTLGFWC